MLATHRIFANQVRTTTLMTTSMMIQLSSKNKQFSTMNRNIYSKISFYKEHSALNLSIIPPKFKLSLDENSWILDTSGSLIVEIAQRFPPNSNRSPNSSSFDWKNKSFFYLGPIQCGEVLASIHKESEFSSSTNKDSIASKTFSMTPSSDGKNTFNIMNLDDASSKVIELSAGEMQTFRCCIEFMIPRLLGIDAVFMRK